MTAILGNRILLILNTGADLTDALEVKIGFIDPDGTAGEITAEVYGTPTDGKIARSYSFDKAGYWRLWAIVDSVYVEQGKEDFIFVYDVPRTSERITSPAFVREVFPDVTVSDLVLEELIDVVEADYRRLRNAPWDGELFGAITYPKGSKLIAAKMVKVHLDYLNSHPNITRESLGSYSVTYSDEGFYGKSITNSIKKYVRFGDAQYVNHQVYETRFRII